MLREQRPDRVLVVALERLERDELRVAALRELRVVVEHVGDAAAHPGREVAPVAPITTTRPPVMYSQPWSPTPSTTAEAPELRTANRSPAMPRKNARPEVAP